MESNTSVFVPIRDEPDVVMARSEVKVLAQQIGFEPVDESRIVTAVSELAINILRHAHCGKMKAFPVHRNGTRGLEIEFQDQGPGITDLESALNGHSPDNGRVGLGLSTSRILVDEFEITSEPGQGTRVVVRKWIRD